MTVALLIRQLRLEFSGETKSDHEQLRYDVGDIWQRWRAGAGRHFQENTSQKFCEWWVNHFEDCLIRDGRRSSYHAFIKHLGERTAYSRTSRSISQDKNLLN